VEEAKMLKEAVLVLVGALRVLFQAAKLLVEGM
jgi:hypothetical protein